ncbi:MAG: TrkA family potassium uptake protein [Halobacteriales archaeon]|nr:TrkA family potassium uptake protein [Halobacteriales archaeon]
MTSNLDVIVVGAGRVGSQAAKHLSDRGHDVMVVERDEDVVSEIADEWFAKVIKGDATNPEILEQAGVEDADAIAALTGETGLNLAVCMVSEEMSEDIRTVVRIERDVGKSYLRFVDGVVFPERAGSRAAVNEIVGSEVQTLADVTSALDIMVITVDEGAPVAGKNLNEVRLPEGSLIVSEGDCEGVAGRETVLEPGESYVVAVEPGVADEVLNLMRG